MIAKGCMASIVHAGASDLGFASYAMHLMAGLVDAHLAPAGRRPYLHGTTQQPPASMGKWSLEVRSAAADTIARKFFGDNSRWGADFIHDLLSSWAIWIKITQPGLCTDCKPRAHVWLAEIDPPCTAAARCHVCPSFRANFCHGWDEQLSIPHFSQSCCRCSLLLEIVAMLSHCLKGKV